MPRDRGTLMDADAFNCLRSLGLLKKVRDEPGFRLVFTRIIARRDLRDLQPDVDALVSAGHADIRELPAKDPELLRLRQAGVDHGEAEAIAWALSQPRDSRLVFVSNDRAARAHAREEGVESADLLDFVIELIDRGIIPAEDASQALAPWDDLRQQQCRPRDWTGFATTVAARRQNPSKWT